MRARNAHFLDVILISMTLWCSIIQKINWPCLSERQQTGQQSTKASGCRPCLGGVHSVRAARLIGRPSQVREGLLEARHGSCQLGLFCEAARGSPSSSAAPGRRLIFAAKTQGPVEVPCVERLGSLQGRSIQLNAMERCPQYQDGEWGTFPAEAQFVAPECFSVKVSVNL